MLTLEEFGGEFANNWRNVRSRVLKSECWQTYQEPDTKSLHEYQRGNFSEVEHLIETEADFDREVYEDVRRNGTPFIRLRLVKMPLSQYATYEMWNYIVRARLAETIKIIDVSADPRPLPNHTHFDFLLFDGNTALIHDYGTTGRQVGGWATSSPDVLERLADTAAQMRSRAVPLDAFLSRHGIEFPPQDLAGRR